MEPLHRFADRALGRRQPCRRQQPRRHVAGGVLVDRGCPEPRRNQHGRRPDLAEHPPPGRRDRSRRRVPEQERRASSSSSARRTAERPGTGLVPRGPKPVGVPGIRSGDGVPNATVAPAERDDLCGLAGLSVLQGEARRRPPHPLHRQGRTWSAPIKVNDTPAGAQAAFLPTVKVDANGRVGVVYYDLRNDTNPRDGSFLTTEWITFSTDGGRTFGPGERGRARLRPRRRGLRPRLLPGRLPGAWRQRSHVHAIFRRRAREQANGQVGSDIFAATAD